MKKLVLLLAVAFSASLYSCGHKSAEATDNAADTAAVVETVVEEVAVVDTLAADSVAPADSAVVNE